MNHAVSRRPTTLEDFHAAGARFRTEEGRARGLAFRPRPSDVFIATYAKAGTTWMQQIVHGLRTGGSMAFGEITEVVPWIEMAFDLGLDPEAEQVAWPRAFKTHLDWYEVPKGGRYIGIVRDPADSIVSSYNFMEGWFFEPGSISFDSFVRDGATARNAAHSYWHHVLSWWQVRERDDVMMLAYEDMKADLPAIVRRVARFIGLDPSPEVLEIATRQAGFDFMKANAWHFDDHLVREKRDAACGLPPGGDSSKVREGATGHGDAKLGPELRGLLDQAWRERIAAKGGPADYAALRRSLG